MSENDIPSKVIEALLFMHRKEAIDYLNRLKKDSVIFDFSFEDDNTLYIKPIKSVNWIKLEKNTTSMDFGIKQ